MPGGMTFDEYFAFDQCKTTQEKQIHLFTGVAPKALHRHYIVDKSWFNFKAQKGNTTPMACQLASGVAVAEAMKILLGRGKICLLYTSPSPRDLSTSRMPSSA